MIRVNESGICVIGYEFGRTQRDPGRKPIYFFPFDVCIDPLAQRLFSSLAEPIDWLALSGSAAASLFAPPPPSHPIPSHPIQSIPLQHIDTCLSPLHPLDTCKMNAKWAEGCHQQYLTVAVNHHHHHHHHHITRVDCRNCASLYDLKWELIHKGTVPYFDLLC